MRLLLLAAIVIFASTAVHADTPLFTLLGGTEGKFVGSGSLVLPFQAYEIKHDFSNFSTFSRAIYLNHSFFFLDESLVTLPYSGTSSGVSHWVLSDALRVRGFRMDVLVPVKSSGVLDWSGAKLGWNENTYHANNTSGGQSSPITTCFDQSDLTKIIDGCTYFETMDIQKLDTSSTVAQSRIQEGMSKYFSWYGGTGSFSVMPNIPYPTNPVYVASAGYVTQKTSKKFPTNVIIPPQIASDNYIPQTDEIDSTSTVETETDQIADAPTEAIQLPGYAGTLLSIEGPMDSIPFSIYFVESKYLPENFSGSETLPIIFSIYDESNSPKRTNFSYSRVNDKQEMSIKQKLHIFFRGSDQLEWLFPFTTQGKIDFSRVFLGIARNVNDNSLESRCFTVVHDNSVMNAKCDYYYVSEFNFLENILPKDVEWVRETLAVNPEFGTPSPEMLRGKEVVVDSKSEKVDNAYPDVQVVSPPIDSTTVSRAEENVSEKTNRIRFLFWEFENPFKQTNATDKKTSTEPNPWWAFLFGQ